MSRDVTESHLRQRLAEELCLQLNRLFPAKRVEGRESLRAYAEFEYAHADWNFALYGGMVSLDGADVLDAGCGMGGKTVRYAEKGCASIVGVDIDANNVAAATSFADSRGAAKVSFQVASLARLPFQDDSFDVVFLDDVLEHILRPVVRDALGECKRVLRPSGRLCLSFSPWTAHDAGHLYDYIHVPWCHLLFSERTLERVIDRLAPQAPATRREDVLTFFHELNRLRHDDFVRIVAELDFDVVSLRRRMIRDVRLLERLPIVREHLTSRTVAVLSKRPRCAIDP